MGEIEKRGSKPSLDGLKINLRLPTYSEVTFLSVGVAGIRIIMYGDGRPRCSALFYVQRNFRQRPRGLHIIGVCLGDVT